MTAQRQQQRQQQRRQQYSHASSTTISTNVQPVHLLHGRSLHPWTPNDASRHNRLILSVGHVHRPYHITLCSKSSCRKASGSTPKTGASACSRRKRASLARRVGRGMALLHLVSPCAREGDGEVVLESRTCFCATVAGMAWQAYTCSGTYPSTCTLSCTCSCN